MELEDPDNPTQVKEVVRFKVKTNKFQKETKKIAYIEEFCHNWQTM